MSAGLPYNYVGPGAIVGAVLPTAPPQTNAYGITYDYGGNLAPNTKLLIQLLDVQGINDSNKTVVQSDANAVLEIKLLRSTRYRISADDCKWVYFTTDGAGTYALPRVLGAYNPDLV